MFRSKRHITRRPSAARSLLASLAATGGEIADGRYLVVPGEDDFAVVWDPREEQIVDVINAPCAGFGDEDEYWIEARHGWVEHRIDQRAA